MKVLSLFDGMSCGQIALKECGVRVDTYYASEVDKFAIAQAMLNFPATIQLGDARNIDARTLGHIDLLIGGSPCQSFSFAGKRAGMSTKQNEEIYTLKRYLELKQAGFEFEGESYLFWEYMRVLEELRETNPDVLFLLENVEMGKKWEGVLTEAIGLRGVHINSSLVSAQNRRRIYWTNIKTRKEGLFGDVLTDIPQLEDRGILLRDILEDDADVDEKYYLSDEVVQKLIEHKRRNAEAGNGFGAVFHTRGGKMSALKIGGKGVDDLVMRNNIKQLNSSSESNNGQQPYQQNRVYDINHKALACCANLTGGAYAIADENASEVRIRRLTPTECSRLQTVPDWYKWECSKTQQYKMLGNGWTIEVIKHIFSFLPEKYFK